MESIEAAAKQIQHGGEFDLDRSEFSLETFAARAVT
jgi:hypothetical protein